MIYPNYRIDMVRGDTLSFGLELEGLGQDLDSADFTVKKNATDSEVLIHKELGDGITKKQTGHYSVRLLPEDTAQMEAGAYHFDLQISVNEDVYTPMLGIFCLVQDVTFDEEVPE